MRLIFLGEGMAEMGEKFFEHAAGRECRTEKIPGDTPLVSK
jgi:hypothetical protein